MRLIITFSDGSVKPAIAAAMSGSRVRAFVPGCDDVAEFNLTSGRWVADDGQEVLIQFGAGDQEFHTLVRTTAESYDSPSDAFEVYLLSLMSPTSAECGRVN
jgi:hypothetical protein